MQASVHLTNTGKPVEVLDQLFDDVYYNSYTPLSNFYFSVEKKEGENYVGYRDHSFRDHLVSEFKSAEELLDSIKNSRPTAFLQLSDQDTLNMDYSLAYGRQFKKGFYRIRAVFVAKLTDKRWFIKSDWQYFEVTQEIIRPKPNEAADPGPGIFWQKNNKEFQTNFDSLTAPTPSSS
jgi:hypothetical protein